MTPSTWFPQIERGIPVPPVSAKPSRRGILAKLEVGDTFSFPYAEISQWQSAAAKLYGRKYTTRRMESGDGRIWRMR